MAQHSAIQDGLSNEDLAAFHSLLNNRRTTIDEAKEWLARRGLRVSRTSVGLYTRKYRMDALYKLRQEGMLGDESSLRKAVQERMAVLGGRQLALLAMFAAHLVCEASGSSLGRRRSRAV